MKYCWVFFVFQEIKNQEIIIDHLKKKKQSLKGKKNKKAVYFIGRRDKKKEKKPNIGQQIN